jgi:PGF-CTERM protein
MVMSVFAGAAAFAGTAVAEHDSGKTLANDGETIVYQGQQAVSVGVYSSSDTEIPLYDDDGTFIDSYDADADGHVVVPTDDLDGVYYLGAKESGSYDHQFQVVPQTLSVSTDASTVNPGDTVTIDLDDSNRNTFDVQVTSESLDAPIGNASSVSEGGQVTATIPSDAATGNYTLDVNVNDSTATDSVDVTVEPEGSTVYSLADSFPSEERGDVLEFTVELENTDSAYVQFGSSDVSYAVGANISDGDDDDSQVTVMVDTYATTEGAGQVLDVAGSDDTIDNASYVAGTGQLSQPVAAGDYDITVYDTDPQVDGGEEQTFGTAVISERSTDAARTWVAPKSASISDASDVYDNVAESDTVAKDDHAVVQVEASGIYSALDDSSALAQNGVNVTIDETNPGPNQNPERINASEVDLVTDAENNTLFLLVDTSASGIDADEEYEATFEVNSNNKLGPSDEPETVSTTFSVTDRTVSFDTNDGDTYVVSQGETEVTGTSTLAPGTEFQVTARSSAANLLKNQIVTVQDDGTWSATFDFSDVDDETEFSFTNKATDDQASAMVMAGFGDEPGTTTTTTETTTETTTTTTTTTTEDGGMTTETDTTTTTEPSDNGGGIPGFGVSVALVAIIAAALLALRRSN